MDLTYFYFDSISPLIIESILSAYILCYISYTVLICNDRKTYGYLTLLPSGNIFLIAVISGLIFNFFESSTISSFSSNGSFYFGTHGGLFQILMLIASGFAITISRHFIASVNLFQSEYNLLLLFSILGLSVLTYSADFLAFYLALELQSLAFYLLATFR